MTTSSITYADFRIYVAIVNYADDSIIKVKDQWSIKIIGRGVQFEFVHVIRDASDYAYQEWDAFLNGAKCAKIRSLRRDGGRYIFANLKGEQDFAFVAPPLDRCLREIIEKAALVGHRFKDD